MSDIRWDNLRNLAGSTLDQLETRQHHEGAADKQADLRARGLTK